VLPSHRPFPWAGRKPDRRRQLPILRMLQHPNAAREFTKFIEH
jgi:hypothetical protein